MGRSVRRELLICLAAAVMVLMIPAVMTVVGVRTPGIETAHAGGDVDLSSVPIKGMSSDGKIFNGETISVTASDLGAAYGMTGSDFLALVKNGEVAVTFDAASYADTDTSFINPMGEGVELKTTLSGDTFSAKVPVTYYPQDGKMIGITLFTHTLADDSHYNNNSTTHAVKNRLSKKAAIDTNSFTYYKYLDHVSFPNLIISEAGEYYPYYYSTDTYTCYEWVIRFYKGTKLIKSKNITSMYNNSIDVPVSYGANKFTVALYCKLNGDEYFANSWTATVQSAGIAQNKVYATKINNNKAVVRWSGSAGVSGYYVYQGSKKVKTVGASTNKVTISKKGAGKAKFKVIPYIKTGGTVVKGKSNTMKAKANSFSRNVSKSYKKYDYGKGQIILKKLSGSGKKYTLTCYAINNRMFKLKKYKKIKITVYADGKKIISKTIKNKKVNMKKYSSKKLTFKLKGKEGDIKHGSVTWSISYVPYWGPGINQW